MKLLLKYMPIRIRAQIANLFFLDNKTATMHVIHFLGRDFFVEEILEKSWFYLLRKELINSESIS
jgi:hypothetical protein